MLIAHKASDYENSNGFAKRRPDRHTHISLWSHFVCSSPFAACDYCYYFRANPLGILGALVAMIFTGHDATHFPSWRDAIFLETERNSLASFGIQKTQFESPKKIGCDRPISRPWLPLSAENENINKNTPRSRRVPSICLFYWVNVTHALWSLLRITALLRSSTGRLTARPSQTFTHLWYVHPHPHPHLHPHPHFHLHAPFHVHIRSQWFSTWPWYWLCVRASECVCLCVIERECVFARNWAPIGGCRYNYSLDFVRASCKNICDLQLKGGVSVRIRFIFD